MAIPVTKPSDQVSAIKNQKFAKYSHKVNGQAFWMASWYAKILGYASLQSFMPTIRKAERIGLYLGVPIEDNFQRCLVENRKDLRLSRFACIIIALQADIRKPIVKKARAYFFEESKDIVRLLYDQDYIQRSTDRVQITALHKLLNKRARASGVRNFRYFQNEGYLGMYNCIASDLKAKKGFTNNIDIYDQMGSIELAANIFRITLTIERLKLIKNPTEEKAAAIHWRVGSQVRQMIRDNTGLYPEELKPSMNLDEIQRNLIAGQKSINSRI